MKKQKKIKINTGFNSEIQYRLNFRKFGFCLLNSYSFYIIPRFFAFKLKYLFDVGISFMGWTLIFQWRNL